ncbi:hypothetical protein HDV00_007549 [Rhizophlyctis rosea]|nr:hypothetical protein HDV00_007549 [Rhizophlyctis rosea]
MVDDGWAYFSSGADFLNKKLPPTAELVVQALLKDLQGLDGRRANTSIVATQGTSTAATTSDSITNATLISSYLVPEPDFTRILVNQPLPEIWKTLPNHLKKCKAAVKWMGAVEELKVIANASLLKTYAAIATTHEVLVNKIRPAVAQYINNRPNTTAAASNTSWSLPLVYVYDLSRQIYENRRTQIYTSEWGLLTKADLDFTPKAKAALKAICDSTDVVNELDRFVLIFKIKQQYVDPPEFGDRGKADEGEASL